MVNLSEVMEYLPDLPAIGDVNDDGGVGLDDTIMTVQILAVTIPGALTVKADVGNDRHLGLEEAVYQLGFIADQR